MLNPIEVIVVGSGIAGLMSAWYAARAGYKVRLLSKSPDPRGASPGVRFESSTWDGYVSRYITLTEGHPYLDLPGYISVMYPDIGEDFRRDVTEGGVLVLPPEQWGELPRRFLRERELANQDREATLRSFHEYIDENRASMEMWYELLTHLVADRPELTERVTLHTQGIDRFYDEAHLFEGALGSQAAQHIVKRPYTVEGLLAEPDFKVYWEGLRRHGFIKGGGLTMYGLALDIQALGREWLLGALEQLGVELCLGPQWEVVGLEKDAAGAILGPRTREGTLHPARHLFLHPGAYMRPETLAGTQAHGRLAGVKGLWMRIKNAQQLFGDASQAPRPNKIHGGKYEVSVRGRTYRGQLTDLNIMPRFNADGTWELAIGSAYLFVGLYPFEGDADVCEPLADPAPEQRRLEHIQLAHELALKAFAQVVAKTYDLQVDLEAVLAGRDERIDIPSKGCIRSWTPDDRELRVLLPTASGGAAIVHGGGNTGTTTKAPFIGTADASFARALDLEPAASAAQLSERYEAHRGALRRTCEQLPVQRWQELEARLNQAIGSARARPLARSA